MPPRSPARSAPVTAAVAIALVALVAAWLAVALVRANPGRGIAAGLELFGAMLWISTVFHAATALVVLAGLGALRVARRRVASGPFLVGALVSLDAAWWLWNRLGMAHQPMSVRPFLTPTGVLQNVALAVLVGIGVIVALAVASRRPGRAAVGVVVAAALAVALLAINGREERGHRRVAPERLLAAATAAGAALPAGAPSAPSSAPSSAVEPGPAVVLLGVDGLEGSVLLPLLQAGRLPNLAALIAAGATGLLDNGDESLSARIWNTIFSGRDVADHGVAGFTKLVLPRTGASYGDLLLLRPTIDTGFGLAHLLARVPSLGLWRIEPTDARDRRVPMLWDVASETGRRVVVANAMTNVPVTPVNGAMLTYRTEADATNTWPPELAARWRPAPWRDPTGRTPAGREDHARRLAEEVAFTVEVARENGADLVVHYTHYLDTLSHWNWDFWSRGDFLLDGAPDRLDDSAWFALVRERADDPAFEAYANLDAQVGVLRAAFPRATFVVCSDHGWTYAGYEHFGGPDGLLVIGGGRAAPGAVVVGARTVDIAPTVLALLGAPLADDLDGRVLDEALASAPAIERVATYGPPRPFAVVPEAAGPDVDPEEVERLRALGYLQ